MNLKSLRVLVHIIQEGTLARAALRLNFSEPAASRLLRLLEEELGVSLFDRRRRRMVPTAIAKQLYPEAVRILAAIDGVPGFIQHLRQDRAVPLRIVCHPRLAYGLVLPAVRRMARRRPEIRVHLEIHARHDLGRFLAQDLFDVGISSLPVAFQSREPSALLESDLQVLVPAGHPLAGLPAVDVGALKPFAYIALTEQTQMRRLADNCMLRAGERLDVHHEVSTSDAAHHLVAAGLGFTITDRFSRGSVSEPDFRFIPLLPRTTIRIGIFQRQDAHRHEAAQDFVDCIHAVSDMLG